MPPEGRRKKKFEQEMRRVQNRNFFAVVVLIIAAVASIYLIQWIFPENKPGVFVSINRVDHSGTREIPFSDESCNVLKQAFEEFLDCKTDEIQQLDEENSKLKLAPKISERDILIVYFNGHVLGKSDSSGSEVYWIGPESERLRERKLSELLASADASPAKTKLILLDAGRYTWSPVFPGRPPNPFQTMLAEKLQTNDWGLGSDFWVITSQSDYEISNVSTPLKTSLFAKSVAESLESLALDSDQPDEIEVVKLFDEIRMRTQSYSRNFNNKSLQNPVLMRAGVGVVNPADTVGPAESDPLRVTWRRPTLQVEENADSKNQPKTAQFSLTEFAQDPENYAQWLYQEFNYSALPNQTIRSLESFLEFGDREIQWPTTDQEILVAFTQKLTQSLRPPPGRPTDFDSETLAKKQASILAYRRALLEFSVLTRFRDQMRFWDDNAFNAVPPLPPRLSTPLKLTENDLAKSETLPPSVDEWMRTWSDFKIRNEDALIEKVQLQLAESGPYSPMQAELLGILSQRYMNLISSSPNVDGTEKPKPRPGDIVISLAIDFKGRFNPGDQPTDTDPGAGYQDVVQKSIAELIQFRNVDQSVGTDSSTRYLLVASGSEFADVTPGIAPDVAWERIAPSIAIRATSPTDPFKIYPYDLMPIPFEVETSAIDDVNLEIVAGENTNIEGLKFGFTPEFKSKTILSDLESTDEAHRKRKTIDVYFQYPKIDSANIGKEFEFQISATDRDNLANSTPKLFRIEIRDEATYLLKSRRQLANKNDDQVTKLFRWGVGPREDEWSPLAIRTLANVTSEFELSLQNNSNARRSFIVKIFKIKEFPNNIDETALRADRDDWEQVSNFSQWLKQQNLERNAAFELIGQANLDDVATEETKPIVFQLPPPTDPEAPKPEPDAKQIVEIDKGALVVFFATDRPNEPAWFQMLKFEPRDSANVSAANRDRMKVKPEIQAVFGDEIAKLKNQLAPLLDDLPAARLTIVSQSSLDGNERKEEVLNLNELLAEGGGARFSPGTEPALLLLDVIGVSNYATYEINGTTPERTPLRKHLAGIRIVSAPEGWQSNPKSWSFAPSTQLGPFAWLSTSDSEDVTNVFIRIPAAGENAGANKQELELEVFLPFKNDDTLHAKPDDFWWRWKFAKTNLFYPNQRQHFVAISGQGMTAWSEVTSHRFIVSDPANKVLEIGQGTQTLGTWRFVSQSLDISPVINANPKSVWNTAPDLKTVLIDVDVREIKPVVVANDLLLKFNGQPLKETADFLSKHPHPEGSGQYRFSLFDIFSEFDVTLKDEKTELKIEVIATDFFGNPTSHNTLVTVAPKPVVKPPPKPVPLVVNFVMQEKPADLLRFDEISINGTALRLKQPLTEGTPYNDGKIKITYSESSSSLKIEGLIPGTYSFGFRNWVKREGDAQYSKDTQSKRGVILKEGLAPLIVEF